MRCGLFGLLAVLIGAICKVAALDLDPRCFPVLDGLFLESSVVPFSATPNCKLDFNFSKSSDVICFLV